MPPAMRNPRILVAVGVLLVAVAVVVVLVAGGSGEDTDRPLRTTRAQLTLESAVQPESGYPELIVSLPEQRLNTLATSGGARSVLLRCVDKRGDQTIRQKHGWPLQEEVGFFPHVHQPIQPQVLRDLGGCRMTGNGIQFTAQVNGRVPTLR